MKKSFFAALVMSLALPFITQESALAQVSADQAKEIALQHAGVQANSVNFTKIEQDMDNGIKEYEIEFLGNNTKFDYTINAETGKIIGHKHEMMRQHHNNGAMHGQNHHQQANCIDNSRATSLALQHANLHHDQVHRLNCYQDMEDGRSVYKVKFWKDYTEYEYEIDAATGDILEFEVEEK